MELLIRKVFLRKPCLVEEEAAKIPTFRVYMWRISARKKNKPEGDYNKEDRGGPLPVGFYIAKHVADHDTFHECAFLKRTLTALLYVDVDGSTAVSSRDNDMYIHGPGPKGSDGCIVIVHAETRKMILEAIKANGDTTLEVHSEGMKIENEGSGRKTSNLA